MSLIHYRYQYGDSESSTLYGGARTWGAATTAALRISGEAAEVVDVMARKGAPMIWRRYEGFWRVVAYKYARGSRSE